MLWYSNGTDNKNNNIIIIIMFSGRLNLPHTYTFDITNPQVMRLRSTPQLLRRIICIAGKYKVSDAREVGDQLQEQLVIEAHRLVILRRSC